MRPITALAALLLLPACSTVSATVSTVKSTVVSSVDVLTGGGDLREAQIAPGTIMHLPAPPGYPGTKSMMQTVRAHYGERQAAFEALLSLSPEKVDIVVTAPSGPRLASITWSKKGVHRKIMEIAPPGIPVGNIVADIFVSLWPREAVAAALPAGVEVRDEPSGRRTVMRGETLIIEVVPDPADPTQRTLRNIPLGYDLRVSSQVLE
jgi:hypothetical protein